MTNGTILTIDVSRKLLVEPSDADQGVVRGLLDDLSDGRVPGFAASGLDGDGEAAEDHEAAGAELATGGERK